MDFDFLQAAWLLLLPLAVLPLLRRRRDTLSFAAVGWLPADPWGRAAGLLWRGFACGAICAAVIGLAGPGRSGTQVLRTGKGAEVLILMDRSSSMDANLMQRDVKSGGQINASRPTKNQVVRELLADFVERRPDDRFALMTFSTSAMLVAPFTQDHATVLAGLKATAIGRGLPDTLMGPALLAAIGQFEHRRYTGSRIVIVVSDGGAQLDDEQRRRIAAGLARQRIGLYWIYIRSGPNSPDLTRPVAGTLDSEEEAALHAFFKTLATPYHLFQTDDPQALASAIAEIDRQQNYPLSDLQQVPRLDYSPGCFLAALLCCLGLLACRALQLDDWRTA
ncbi:vWA domain-containing protein [Rubrivivax gelatinosus]|uniref:von Willebrand factor, type A n=2 Tax=Rubrivivax gelatinosus TaxID=28068 RepID=I0HRN5_RUBGI|nr:vWA domain-containing protein [Rubrivivax gelatinosus]MBG6082203.1 mxaC protein [Rubrivivax gelatinosus]BAL95672.1 von Willebrand factor, type A [Rubrivivax gelatinosus IL144]